VNPPWQLATTALVWLTAAAAPWLLGLRGGRIAAWILLVAALALTTVIVAYWVYRQTQPLCADDANGDSYCPPRGLLTYAVFAAFPFTVGLSAALKLRSTNTRRARLVSQHSQ
jgi:hypothetical protein